MSRVVILSNRIPTEAEPSGGLVVALHDCLNQRGGVWIGSSDHTVDSPSDTLTKIGTEPYTRLAFDLTQEEHDDFYLGYANSVLWPLFHRRSDLIRNEARFSAAYAAVNIRVARMLASELRPDDLVWVHDYHFLPIAHELRKLGVLNQIGFFLHTPFPLSGDLLALPERQAFPRWIASYNLVGLQTKQDVSTLLQFFRSQENAELVRDGSIRTRYGHFWAMAFPIGIDVNDFTEQAQRSDGAAKLNLPKGESLLIGVDRLDYSKGLPNRFKAFETYLNDHAKDRPRATFLQIASPSRSELDAYKDIRSELEHMTGAINGTYAEFDWTPLRLMCRNVPRDRLAGHLRRAQVGLVTPLADGMNLVAKEYVAAQDPENPGVLVLSNFAGAAEQLPDAILVNPYDSEEVAAAIAKALDMPLDQRIERHGRMMRELRAHDISWWSDSFLAALDHQPLCSKRNEGHVIPRAKTGKRAGVAVRRPNRKRDGLLAASERYDNMKAPADGDAGRGAGKLRHEVT